MDSGDIVLSDFSYSISAEQSVLGAAMSDANMLPVIMELVKPEYFFNENHKKIFGVIYRMFTGGSAINAVTVLNECERYGIFESSAEGKRYFVEIAGTLPSADEKSVRSYCKIVTDRYYIRQLNAAARSIIEDIQSGENDAQLLLDSAEQRIYDIRDGRNTTSLKPLSDAVLEAYDRLGKITGDNKDQYIGARTGFTFLDNKISGLNKSDLIIIAARPGMGKTSFAMNIATNVARRSSDKTVVVFNLEMSSEQLATRLLSTEALIKSDNLRNGRIHTDEWTRLAAAAANLSTFPMFIDDSANMTVQQMKAKLRRVKDLGLVVIDYLQLMGSTSRSDNRVTVVSEITRQLKIMAKELNVPVVLLSQLSRAVESRTDKRPVMSDLRESGSIEQDADIILFLYRDSYYNKESQKQNISECIVAKNRHGETDTIELIWNGQFTRFSDPEYSAPPEA